MVMVHIFQTHTHTKGGHHRHDRDTSMRKMSRSFLIYLCSTQLVLLLSTLIAITSSENQPMVNDGFANARYDPRFHEPSDLTFRLEDYPNYAMKLSLAATSSNHSSDKNFSITFVPPRDHGILIIVQYPRDSYESQSKSLQHAYRYFSPEMRRTINEGELLCLDYLTILNPSAAANANADSPVLIQSCAYLSSSHNQDHVRSYFKGVEYFANEANQEVTLLRIPAANPNEGHSLKPTLFVTSYVVCSNFLEATRKNLYKECGPGGAQNPDHVQHEDDHEPNSHTFCVPSKLFCDGNTNCIHREDRNGSEAIIIGVDETDCKTTHNAVAFSPLFPTKGTTTSAPVVVKVDDAAETIEDSPPKRTTTKRPWWKPIIPPWTFGSSSETTTTPKPTTTTVNPHWPRTIYADDNARSPWYSPGSPFGTVIIFAAVVILVFGICSFLAKVHSTRPVYASNHRAADTESPSLERPFSSESNSFARQLIEMIEAEEELRNSQDRRPHSPSHHGSTATDINLSDYIRAEIRAPPPKYNPDDILPSYDSLFRDGKGPEDDKKQPPQ